MLINKYGAILADPPWRFKTWSSKGRDRCPDAQSAKGIRHYKVQSLETIKGIFNPEWADRNCCLFMWCVDSMLPDAIDVGRAWGFEYKTVAFTWVKSKNGKHPIGLGYWTRANPETCLLFAKGKPKRKSAAVRQLILSERREHSRKPDEQYERIESLVNGPYLEMFARPPHREGWDVFGDEAVNSEAKLKMKHHGSGVLYITL